MRLCFGLLLAATALVAQSDVRPFKAINSVDIDRYIGSWYEVARLPNRFQSDCASDTTANYAKQTDGRLSVVNECRKADGSAISAQGTARRVGPSKLKVRFAPAWLAFLPIVWEDYWVIDLAEDYFWAVVGEPKVEESLIQGIVERAHDQGYDLSSLGQNREVNRSLNSNKPSSTIGQLWIESESAGPANVDIRGTWIR